MQRFPKFQYPAISASSNLQSLDLTGVALMPGRLAEYLTKSDCRSLKSLKVFSDEQIKRIWLNSTEHCLQYDFCELNDALQHAPNLERFECSFPGGRPWCLFGSFKSLTRLQVLKVDFRLINDMTISETTLASPHLQQPTKYLPASLKILSITQIPYVFLYHHCQTRAQTPNQRADAVRYLVHRLQLLHLQELHLQVCMFYARNRPGRSIYNILELQSRARKFLPQLIARLREQGLLMKVWRARIPDWREEVLLYGPGYARPWPHWSLEDETRGATLIDPCDGGDLKLEVLKILRSDEGLEFPEDLEYIKSEDDTEE
ncbi:hypothetical protein P171DRAFT_234354 [Karstenula rhodostoma CBS 690.94]|uniref:Uncharacterized protein n=1 Tax=Karstenula rhodostoma CBS 690.94 TaxID=1392251 RepID=A0A9P4PS75_9PLEO|nr:hypothetical protein P171DRAFT_234354 [Karstenula rhodostoma CBS 690.94]